MEKLPDGVTREGDDQDPATNPGTIPKPVPVQLPKNCTWSNEPTHLALATYFDPTKPNLATDFGLTGLQPIIRDSQEDVFLLKDDHNQFYQWSTLDGIMWQLENVQDAQQAVALIMRDSGILKKSQVWDVSTA